MRGAFCSKFVTLVCVISVALVLVPGNANADKDGYTVTLLANPDEVPYIYANDINDSGRIVGGMEFPVGGAYHQSAVMWKKWSSDPVVLEGLEGHDYVVAYAINNKGQVCGRSTDWTAELRAVVWDRHGNVKDMHPDLGGWWSEMWDINQYGDGTGFVYGPGRTRAFIYPANGDDPYLLALDTDVYVHSWPYEINKDMVVVGFARYDDGSGWGPTHACFWDEDGKFEDLHDDIEDDLGTDCVASKAWGVSDSGEIGGVAVVTQDTDTGIVTEAKAFVWTKENGFDWVDSDGSDLSAIGGGGGKRFVGTIDGVLQYPQWYGASVGVWTRGTVKGETVWNLDVLPMPDGYDSMIAWRANTAGRVVGVAADGDNVWSAFYATK